MGSEAFFRREKKHGSCSAIAPPGQEGWLRRRRRRGGGSGLINRIHRPGTTTPSASSMDASRHFLEVASTPPGQEGQSVRHLPASGIPHVA